MRLAARLTTATTMVSGRKTARVIAGLIVIMIARATVAKTVLETKSLKVINESVTLSTSSRKRLIASPADDGRALAAGSSSTRRSMFFCNSAALVRANGVLVNWQVIRQTM